jgi:cytoskeletal protein CcmA (bactofilin family)
MIKDQDFREFHYNILGKSSSLTGDLVLSGDSIITSHIVGSVEVKDDGKLTLERGSFVKGSIKAIDLEVFGTVEGEIICSGLVAIRSSAVVTGSIKSGRLVIYPGAVVEMTATPMDET